MNPKYLLYSSLRNKLCHLNCSMVMNYHKEMMQKVVLGLLLTLNLMPQGHSKVDPPNYNFKFEELLPFFPGKPLGPIKAKYPKLKPVFDDGVLQQYKVKVSQLRYAIPVHFNVYKNKVLDFYAKLPSYFLHDVFHQSLINRYKKQQEYKLKNGTAFYKWKQKDQTMIYSSTCTITCFPIFLASYKNSYPEKELTKYLPYFFRTQTQGSFKN